MCTFETLLCLCTDPLGLKEYRFDELWDLISASTPAMRKKHADNLQTFSKESLMCLFQNESSCDTDAHSSLGAYGLGQMTPIGATDLDRIWNRARGTTYLNLHRKGPEEAAASRPTAASLPVLALLRALDKDGVINRDFCTASREVLPPLNPEELAQLRRQVPGHRHPVTRVDDHGCPRILERIVLGVLPWSKIVLSDRRMHSS